MKTMAYEGISKRMSGNILKNKPIMPSLSPCQTFEKKTAYRTQKDRLRQVSKTGFARWNILTTYSRIKETVQALCSHGC